MASWVTDKTITNVNASIWTKQLNFGQNKEGSGMFCALTSG